MGLFVDKRRVEVERRASGLGTSGRAYIDGGVPDGKVLRFIFSLGFIHYYLFKNANNKEFKRVVNANIRKAPEKIIEGLGGKKNLKKVTTTANTLTVSFKCPYLLNKQLIQESGGIGIFFGDHRVSFVFGCNETRRIAKEVRFEIKRNKKVYKISNVD